jgi:hypothetical protein
MPPPSAAGRRRDRAPTGKTRPDDLAIVQRSIGAGARVDRNHHVFFLLIHPLAIPALRRYPARIRALVAAVRLLIA